MHVSSVCVFVDPVGYRIFKISYFAFVSTECQDNVVRWLYQLVPYLLAPVVRRDCIWFVVGSGRAPFVEKRMGDVYHTVIFEAVAVY